jgi:hypothetical protein
MTIIKEMGRVSQHYMYWTMQQGRERCEIVKRMKEKAVMIGVPKRETAESSSWFQFFPFRTQQRGQGNYIVWYCLSNSNNSIIIHIRVRNEDIDQLTVMYLLCGKVV